MLPAQLLVLVRPGGGRLDLPQLEPQQVDLAVARAGRVPQRLEPRRRLPPQRVGAHAGGAPLGLLAAAEAVQDVELRRGERQTAVLVLSVEGQQPRRQVAQLADPDRPSVQIGAGSAVAGHPPGEDQIRGVVGEPLRQPAAKPVGELEHPLDIGFARAGPDRAGASAATEQEVERVGQDRLPRAGLAGQHVEAAGEPQLGALDQQQVLHA